jgi:hypothetical protein
MIAETAAKMSPEVSERERAAARRIEQAKTVEELLDLIPIAVGTAHPSWHRRLRESGEQAVPPITQRLRHAREIEGQHLRSVTYENLLSALRWMGDAAALALLDCFDELSAHGKSLACVSLGLLGAQEAVPTIWAFYEKTKEDRGENYLVGALWGLIDLKNWRAADALAELLFSGHFFFELFGFLSMAGDERAVLPLLLLSNSGARIGENVPQDAAMALLSIGHRLGRASLLAEFQNAGRQTPQQQRQQQGIVDHILATSPSKAEEYFTLFYHGLRLEDLDGDDVQTMTRRLRRAFTDGHLPRPGSSTLPEEHPGRNDPCWCGSGKKYKYCHLREDQRRSR